jgi:hypothetical protein
MEFRALSYFLLLPFLVSTPLSAQDLGMEGWDKSTNDAGTITYTKGGNVASISVVKLPSFDPALVNLNLSQMASALDKPGICPGYSRSAPQPMLNGRAAMITLDTAKYRCTALVGSSDKAGILVIAMEEIDAAAGAREKVGALFKQNLGQPAETTPPALSSTAQTKDVVAVFYRSQMILMAGGPVGNLVKFENLTMLFANGEACYNCIDDWLKDPSFAEYRRSNPKDVGTWRKQGAKYYVSYPGSREPFDFDAARSLRPGSANFTLHNSFKTSGVITSGSSESYTTAAYNDWLEFNRDGRFTYSSDGSFFGTGNGGSVAGTSSKKGRSGRYAINGFQIQFAYDDGETKTMSFAYDPNNKDYVIIDGSIYTHSVQE